MSKVYDISAKITNNRPTIKITKDIICEVNNRKSTVLNVQAMFKEAERKNTDEREIIEKALVLLLGKDNAEKLEKLDLPFPEYMEAYHSVVALAQGNDPTEEKETPSN